MDMKIIGHIPEETLSVNVQGYVMLLDLKSLLSNYTCIYGQGCQGTTHPREGGYGISPPGSPSTTGCCRTAPQFGPDPEDTPERIAPYVDMLEEQDCENVKLVRSRGWVSSRTAGAAFSSSVRLTGGNCIFLNSSEHVKPGCSLWHLAERIGERPQDLRPSVCHTEPLIWLRVDDGDEDAKGVYLITLRPHWLGWFDPDAYWCTKDPAAHRETTPVYQRMDEQLLWILGPVTHAAVVEALDVAWKERGGRIREQQWGKPVYLPSPTFRGKVSSIEEEDELSGSQ